jgi:uncharacterized protein with HEPN domain
MKDKDLVRLQHMLDYALEAVSTASGRKRSDLDGDRLLMHTLARLVEIIGEAATNISQETRNQLEQFEWSKIIGMRNRIVHVYFKIDLDILWDTVNNNLPELIKELEKIPELN